MNWLLRPTYCLHARKTPAAVPLLCLQMARAVWPEWCWAESSETRQERFLESKSRQRAPGESRKSHQKGRKHKAMF